MRTGRRIALDIGKVRVGVAVSDFHGILATPLGFAPRAESLEDTLANLRSLLSADENLSDLDFLEGYVGLPIGLHGGVTASTNDAIEAGEFLLVGLGVPVRFLDERLTTVSAAAALRSARISAKNGRAKVDAAAAAVILEQALATEKSQGLPIGQGIEEVRDLG